MTLQQLQIPIIPCTRNETGALLIFKCPFCKQIHKHGAVNTDFGAGNGYRQSHCRLYEGEYYIYEIDSEATQ